MSHQEWLFFEADTDMNYERSIEYHGDPVRAFAAASNILMPNNFRLVEKTLDHVVYEGAGMISSHQSPLVGATRIRIEAKRDRLNLTAWLGGIQFMTRFLCVIPFALAALLSGIFAALELSPLRETFLIAFLSVSPWIVLSPLMSVWLKRRTERALDILLSNLAAMANES